MDRFLHSQLPSAAPSTSTIVATAATGAKKVVARLSYYIFKKITPGTNTHSVSCPFRLAHNRFRVMDVYLCHKF